MATVRKIVFALGVLSALCLGACSSAGAGESDQRRTEYTLGSHSFYYTVTGGTATTELIDLSVFNGVGGESQIPVGSASVSLPFTSTTYQVTLTGSFMAVNISGDATDSGTMNLVVSIYEDGTMLATQVFSGTGTVSGPLSFSLTAQL